MASNWNGRIIGEEWAGRTRGSVRPRLSAGPCELCGAPDGTCTPEVEAHLRAREDLERRASAQLVSTEVSGLTPSDLEVKSGGQG